MSYTHNDVFELTTRLKGEIEKYNKSHEEITARLANVEQLAVRGSAAPAGVKAGELKLKLKSHFENDSAFQHLAAWNQGTSRAMLEISIKSLTNESSATSSNDGVIPSQPERVGIVGPVLAQPRLLDFLPVREVMNDSVEFIQLSSDDDPDYQLGEGTEKAKLDFSGTKKRANIVTIAGHTTASRQVLSDHATLAQQINSVVARKLLNKLCYEVINGIGGNGDEQRIEGLMTQATTLSSHAATTFADRIGEAIAAQSSLGFQPGVIVLNPMTWFEEIAIAKTQTEHAYLFGSPASPLPPALWNLPVAIEPSMPDGEALVLDTNYITLLDRQQISILVSNSHADNFTKNLITILGELRAGLEVLHSGAVVKVQAASSN